MLKVLFKEVVSKRDTLLAERLWGKVTVQVLECYFI